MADDRARRAQARAAEARCRAVELQDRGARLAVRQPTTAADVRRAQSAALTAHHHARQACTAAAVAYRRAAAAHRAAALRLERSGLPNLAALHLRAAARDDTAGAQEIRRLRGELVAPSG